MLFHPSQCILFNPGVQRGCGSEWAQWWRMKFRWNKIYHWRFLHRWKGLGNHFQNQLTKKVAAGGFLRKR